MKIKIFAFFACFFLWSFFAFGKTQKASIEYPRKNHSIGADFGLGFWAQDFFLSQHTFPSLDPVEEQEKVDFSGKNSLLSSLDFALFYQYHFKYFSLDARVSYFSSRASYEFEGGEIKTIGKINEIFLGLGAGYFYEITREHVLSCFLHYHHGLWGKLNLDFTSPKDAPIDLYVPGEISSLAAGQHSKITLTPSYHFKGLLPKFSVGFPISYKIFKLKDHKYFSKSIVQGFSFDYFRLSVYFDL